MSPKFKELEKSPILYVLRHVDHYIGWKSKKNYKWLSLSIKRHEIICHEKIKTCQFTKKEGKKISWNLKDLCEII